MHWEEEFARNYVMAWVFIIYIASALISLVVADDYHEAKLYVIALTVICICIEAIIYLFTKAFGD